MKSLKSAGYAWAGLVTLVLASPAAAQLAPPWSATGTGVSRDCQTGRPECSLRLNPSPCGTRGTVSQSLGVPLAGGKTFVSFSARLDTTVGNTDSSFNIRLANGGLYVLGVTSGYYSPNNGVELLYYPPGGGSQGTGVFASLAAGSWHDITLTFDPAVGVTARVGGAMSSPVPAPGATSISSVEFDAVYWCGNSSAGFRYDSFNVSSVLPF